MTYVNQWWLVPIQVTTQIPNLGCDEEENYSVQTAQWHSKALKQQDCGTVHLQGSSGARWPLFQAPLEGQLSRQLCFVPVSFAFLWPTSLCAGELCSVPFCSGFHWCTLLCCGETSSVFQLSQVDSVFSGKGKCIQPEGSWLIQTEAPAPSPWLACCPHANKDSKSS